MRVYRDVTRAVGSGGWGIFRIAGAETGGDVANGVSAAAGELDAHLPTDCRASIDMESECRYGISADLWNIAPWGLSRWRHWGGVHGAQRGLLLGSGEARQSADRCDCGAVSGRPPDFWFRPYDVASRGGTPAPAC